MNFAAAVAEPPASRKTPARSEVRPEDTWDLAPLFSDDAAWENEFKQLTADYKKIAEFRGRVGESAATLRDALEFEKSIDQRLETLNQFAALRTTEDASNHAALAREARLQGVLVQIGEAFSFLGPEIQALDDATFDRFVADPALAEWSIPLAKLRRLKPHTLTANEERLLALSSGALAGHQETFSQLMNVDMKFGVVVDQNGREIELTQSSYSSLLHQRDGRVRREAFEKFYEEIKGHEFTLASTLASSVRSDVFQARARNYPSAIEAALFRDDVPLSVYDNLIAAVRKNLPTLHRYYDLRRRLLGLDEIHHYDTYVPLVEGVHTHIEWDEAVDKVLSAVRPLGDEYVSTLGHGLRDGRWCDRYENKGKRSGAFSYGTYTSPPYIMMNYKADVFSDVYTLAHEAGHSMHTWYSQRTQLFQNYHYPIFVAEVASTFNEMLLTHHLLEETTDPKMRAYLLSRQIDDLRGTLFRQTMFAEFEKVIHAIEERGDALTLESMTGSYRELLDAYFGPDFVIDDALALEGLRIPHFYGAFYVYKYATGISAAVTLSQQVLAGGDASRYLDFLRSGGAKFPIDTLVDAGVDMRTPEPVDTALALFARRVDELEQLLV